MPRRAGLRFLLALTRVKYASVTLIDIIFLLTCTSALQLTYRFSNLA